MTFQRYEPCCHPGLSFPVSAPCSIPSWHSFSSHPQHPLLSPACTSCSSSILSLSFLPIVKDCSSNLLVSLAHHAPSCSFSCGHCFLLHPLSIFLSSSLSLCLICTASLSQCQPCFHFFTRQLPSGQTSAPLFPQDTCMSWKMFSGHWKVAQTPSGSKGNATFLLWPHHHYLYTAQWTSSGEHCTWTHPHIEKFKFQQDQLPALVHWSRTRKIQKWVSRIGSKEGSSFEVAADAYVDQSSLATMALAKISNIW